MAQVILIGEATESRMPQSQSWKELQKLIKKAERTENGRIEEITNLSSEEIKKTKVCELSQYSTKKTNYKKETTKQESDRLANKSESFAAATSKETLEGEKNQRGSNPHSVEPTALNSKKKVKSGTTELNIKCDVYTTFY